MDSCQYHIFSPYRVCPLGAHVDHQHGLVTGFAIDKGVDLLFNVREDEVVKLKSLTFEGDGRNSVQFFMKSTNNQDHQASINTKNEAKHKKKRR